MTSETRNCQNCKNHFIIEPEDFQFYEKVKVPAPTFCPKCRLQRRLAFFNIWHLYKRKCDLCKEEKISIYPPGAPYVVYCPQCWWGDGWDPFSYGRDYDFSRPFFDQLKELWHTVPLPGLSIDLDTARVAPYNNHAGHLKNCYLVFFADFCEDCAYGFYYLKNKMVFDCAIAMLSESSYDCMNLFKSSRCVGTRGNITESLNCTFLRDSDNCQDCFASANLRNKKYYIFNKAYTKEDYFREVKKWDLGSYRTYQEAERLAREHWKKFPPRPKYDDFSVNSTGSYVFQSKNCKECYEVTGAQDSKFLLMLYMAPIKDCYDYTSWGNNAQLLYECCVAGENVSNMRFCHESGLNFYNGEYCRTSIGGSNHFGCVAAKKGNYCILNKRYPETEFYELRERIIKHMNEMPYTDKLGRVYRYGEFFPPEFSPHAYNETLAQSFFPLSSETAEKSGYRWYEPETHHYQITKSSSALPDHIKDVPDSILSETIGCQTCSRGFKITRLELDFLRQMNLPLPRRCPFCRIGDKFNQWVKQLTLVTRTCSKCGNDFETHYPKEKAEYILCKECYLKEVV